MKGESSTVLIVDDEEMSRIVMAAQLEDDGFRVAVAKDAAEALGLLEKRRGRFAVAVLDSIMPGMSGFELVREIERRHPGLPAIFLTSYRRDDWHRDGYVYPWRVGQLEKPFPLAKLGEMVKDGITRFG